LIVIRTFVHVAIICLLDSRPSFLLTAWSWRPGFGRATRSSPNPVSRDLQTILPCIRIFVRQLESFGASDHAMGCAPPSIFDGVSIQLRHHSLNVGVNIFDASLPSTTTQ
jgi:hypothetical protein